VPVILKVGRRRPASIIHRRASHRPDVWRRKFGSSQLLALDAPAVFFSFSPPVRSASPVDDINFVATNLCNVSGPSPEYGSRLGRGQPIGLVPRETRDMSWFPAPPPITPVRPPESRNSSLLRRTASRAECSRMWRAGTRVEAGSMPASFGGWGSMVEPAHAWK